MNAPHDSFVLTSDMSFEDLFVLIDAEAPRLMKLYEDADWSGLAFEPYCFHASFEESGKHWWSRIRTVEYAMMSILEVIITIRYADTKHPWQPRDKSHDVYLRNDGKLFFLGEDSGMSYQPTREYFVYSTREEVAAFLGFIRQCQEPLLNRIKI